MNMSVRQHLVANPIYLVVPHLQMILDFKDWPVHLTFSLLWPFSLVNFLNPIQNNSGFFFKKKNMNIIIKNRTIIVSSNNNSNLIGFYSPSHMKQHLDMQAKFK